MRKLLVLFFSFFLFIPALFGDGNIHLIRDVESDERHRNEMPGDNPDPTFHAEVQEGNVVLVFSDTQTTYEVSIYNYNRSQLIYQGTTVNGVLHMTSTLPVGIYRIEVTTSDQSYYGTFIIK